MSEPSLTEVMQAIKSLEQKIEVAQENNLSIIQIAARLGCGKTTINTWKKENTLNAFGIPFCEHYHWTNQGGITYFADRCEAWLRNNPEQVEDFTKCRQTIFKISKKPKTSLAS